MIRPETADPKTSSVNSVALASRIKPHLPEIFFSLMVLALVIIRILQQYRTFSHLPGSDWNSSEWMIDYAAGFVRRGLGGAFLAQIIRSTSWGFFPIWTTITTLAYLGLCAYIVVVSWRLRGPAVWRFALLLNPILLISASDHGSFARKDALFTWATLLNAFLGHYVLQHERTPSVRTRNTLLVLSFTLLSSVTLALLHEGIFLFAWFPLNLTVLAYILSRLRFNASSIALLLSFAFAPALVAVTVGAYRHGDAQTAQTICRSWHSLGIATVCSPGDAFPPAVDALSWSPSQGISRSLKYAWKFPAYPVMFAVAGSVEILAILVLIPTARLKHLLALLVLPFAASLPLFLLGEDWGRWLCLLATFSLMVMLSDHLRPASYCFLPAILRTALIDRIAPPIECVLGSLRRQVERHPLLFCIALVMLPVPPFPSVRGMILSNPLVIILTFLHSGGQ
jgi:hypothetical protein